MKKILISSLVTTMLLGIIAPSASVFAAESEPTHANIIEKTQQMPKENTSFETAVELGISDEQIDAILNLESPNITLKNGVAYDKDNKVISDYQQDGIQTRGKLSWAVKALRAAWGKIPTKVKTAIGGLAGFNRLLSVIDTFTGKVEDAVYTGCKTLGMSDNLAWWVTKSLMIFL